jgi:hypothetical protein
MKDILLFVHLCCSAGIGGVQPELSLRWPPAGPRRHASRAARPGTRYQPCPESPSLAARLPDPAVGLRFADSLHCRLMGKLEYPEGLSVTSCLAESGYCYIGNDLNSGQINVVDVSDTLDIRPVAQVRTGLENGIPSMCKSGRYLYAIGMFGKLAVSDVANPARPALVGTLSFADTMAHDIAVQGAYAHISDETGLRVVSISNPARPVPAAHLDLGECEAIAVAGRYACLALRDTLVVADVQNPNSPQRRGSLSEEDWSWVYDIQIRGTHAFVATYAGMAVVDISDPDNPATEAFLDLGWCVYLELAGSFAYLGGYSGPTGVLHVLDITDPANPVLAGRYDDLDVGRGHLMSVSGALVYNTGTAALRVISHTGGGARIVGQVGDWVSFGVAVQDTFAYVAAGSNGMRIVNCADPARPVEVGFLPAGHALDVAVRGTFVYLADDTVMRIVNVVNPGQPQEVGRYPARREIYGLAVRDTFAYLACLDSGLVTVRVANPASPVRAGTCIACSSAAAVFVKDTLAFVADWARGLSIVRVANPAQASEIGRLDDSLGLATGVHVRGRYAYLADDGAGLRVIDVGNPRAPAQIGGIGPGWSATAVWAGDTFACVAGDEEFSVVNVLDPRHPSVVGSIRLRAEDVEVQGRYAYVPGWERGLSIIDVANPVGGFRVAGQMEYPLGNAIRDAAVSGDYAFMTSDSGLQVVSLNPLWVPRGVATYRAENLEQVCVSGNYAFVTQASDDSLLVLDISSPENPTRVGALHLRRGEPGPIARSGSLLCIGCDIWRDTGGIQVVDVTDPSNPAPRGFCYMGTAVGIRGVAVADTLAFATGDSAGRRGFFAVNIANPDLPRNLGFCRTNGYPFGIAVRGSYCYIGGGDTCGLLIYDVAQPGSPVRIGQLHEQGSYTRGVALSGDYVCVADNQLGLRIIDATPPQNPALAGFYRPHDDSYHSVTVAPTFMLVCGDGRLSVLVSDLQGIEEVTSPGPEAAEALSVSPCPFRQTAVVRYSLTRSGPVSLKLYDAAGKQVSILMSGSRRAGIHDVTLDARLPVLSLSSGVYVLKLTTDRSTRTRRIVLAQ